MNNIKQLRQNLSMSRVELSKQSGVPARTVDDWENGRRKPRDVYQLKKIADVLGCYIEDLINWDNEESGL